MYNNGNTWKVKTRTVVRWFLGFIVVYGIFNNTHYLKPIIC